MPAYGTALSPPGLYEPGGQGALLFGTLNTITGVITGESPISGTLSQQVAVAQSQSQSQKSISVEYIFSGNPGAFEYHIVEADTDAAGNYFDVPVGGVTIAAVLQPQAGGRYIARVDLVPFAGLFVAIYVKTQMANNNTITVIAKVTSQ